MVGRWPPSGKILKSLWRKQTSLLLSEKKVHGCGKECAELDIVLPDCTDIKGLEQLASQFEANASRSVFRDCVGALDGLTVFVKAPSAAEAENVLAYYSGHYKHGDSLNVHIRRCEMFSLNFHGETYP